MTELSPAALTVWSAFLDRYEWEVTTEELFAVAAALRAAAEELHYKEQLGWTGYGYYTDFQNQIRAIADELEDQ